MDPAVYEWTPKGSGSLIPDSLYVCVVCVYVCIYRYMYADQPALLTSLLTFRTVGYKTSVENSLQSSAFEVSQRETASLDEEEVPDEAGDRRSASDQTWCTFCPVGPPTCRPEALHHDAASHTCCTMPTSTVGCQSCCCCTTDNSQTLKFEP